MMLLAAMNGAPRCVGFERIWIRAYIVTLYAPRRRARAGQVGHHAAIAPLVRRSAHALLGRCRQPAGREVERARTRSLPIAPMRTILALDVRLLGTSHKQRTDAILSRRPPHHRNRPAASPCSTSFAKGRDWLRKMRRRTTSTRCRALRKTTILPAPASCCASSR